MNEKKSFALAEKAQKRIQEEHPHYKLIKRRDEIEIKLRVKNENCES